MYLWVICGILAAALLVLWWKLCALRRSATLLREQLSQWLTDDTNARLRVSCRDQKMRLLAAELDRQLRALRKEQLRCRSGNRELNEAITNISHDLRTPLTAICGYLALLEQEEKSEAVTRYLAFIAKRAEAMKQLTEELFRYSMISAEPRELQIEPVDLNGALEESLAGFYAAFSAAGIIPEIRLPEGPVLRSLDRTALTRILQNILNNALKYSKGDLSIQLTEEGELRFSNLAPGMTSVQAAKLFDRFFTVEAARNSTGLGLAIARQLAEQMGGTIEAHCEAQHLHILLRFPEKV